MVLTALGLSALGYGYSFTAPCDGEDGWAPGAGASGETGALSEVGAEAFAALTSLGCS